MLLLSESSGDSSGDGILHKKIPFNYDGRWGANYENLTQPSRVLHLDQTEGAFHSTFQRVCYVLSKHVSRFRCMMLKGWEGGEMGELSYLLTYSVVALAQCGMMDTAATLALLNA